MRGSAVNGPERMLSFALIIALAGLIYGAIHSFLATVRVKRWAQQRWGKDLVDRRYRLAFSLTAVVTFLPILGLVLLLPDRRLYSIPAPWVWLTSGVQALALVIFFVALFQTDVWRFIGLRQMLQGGTPIPAERHERLVTSGPYAWVRHPLYTTAIVLMWLWPEMTVNLLTFFAISTAYLYLGSVPEESKMIDEFGDAYRQYQKQVPHLIPRPWRSYHSAGGADQKG